MAFPLVRADAARLGVHHRVTDLWGHQVQHRTLGPARLGGEGIDTGPDDLGELESRHRLDHPEIHPCHTGLGVRRLDYKIRERAPGFLGRRTKVSARVFRLSLLLPGDAGEMRVTHGGGLSRSG
ncbi:hypothetical protein [Kitasatospora sp. NPDC088346]|uniref:hypothetical protein n=1 Tax=Kitasatospora sp. NPDC088346 TaxID=3364073 RepID=UPI00382BA972